MAHPCPARAAVPAPAALGARVSSRAMMRRVLIAAAAVLCLVSAGAPALAPAAEQRAWVKSIPDAATWKRYSSHLGADEFGKFIIDVKSDDIYFIDVNLFKLHADFVLGV